MGQSAGSSRGGVLTAGDLTGASRDWADRRKEPRIPCDREISVLPSRDPGGAGFRAAGLFDCSARGIGIVSLSSMEVGEQFLAKLRLDRVLLAAYTVRHCTRAADGRHFKIGAELTALIGASGGSPQAALDALLGSPA